MKSEFSIVVERGDHGMFQVVDSPNIPQVLHFSTLLIERLNMYVEYVHESAYSTAKNTAF